MSKSDKPIEVCPKCGSDDLSRAVSDSDENEVVYDVICQDKDCDFEGYEVFKLTESGDVRDLVETRDKLVNDQRASVTLRELFRALYENSGVDTVREAGINANLPLTECPECELPTPTVINAYDDECAACGSTKPTQEVYLK